MLKSFLSSSGQKIVVHDRYFYWVTVELGCHLDLFRSLSRFLIYKKITCSLRLCWEIFTLEVIALLYFGESLKVGQ